MPLTCSRLWALRCAGLLAACPTPDGGAAGRGLAANSRCVVPPLQPAAEAREADGAGHQVHLARHALAAT